MDAADGRRATALSACSYYNQFTAKPVAGERTRVPTK